MPPLPFASGAFAFFTLSVPRGAMWTRGCAFIGTEEFENGHAIGTVSDALPNTRTPDWNLV